MMVMVVGTYFPPGTEQHILTSDFCGGDLGIGITRWNRPVLWYFRNNDCGIGGCERECEDHGNGGEKWNNPWRWFILPVGTAEQCSEIILRWQRGWWWRRWWWWRWRWALLRVGTAVPPTQRAERPYRLLPAVTCTHPAACSIIIMRMATIIFFIVIVVIFWLSVQGVEI